MAKPDLITIWETDGAGSWLTVGCLVVMRFMAAME
jgi:hypothetical protein